MSNLVIVALPQEDDPIYKVSSEKVPHLTILFLGPSDNEEQIALFLQHATKMCLTRFGLDVDRRGTLGPDNADVVFFQDNWELPRVKQFRDVLLKNNSIKTAYDSVSQFQAPQDWTPHLTLGYPGQPAKSTSERIYWVQFDRIALWTGDYSGPEFILDKYEYDSQPMEVAMSDQSAAGRQFLAHHGILGMKWGHRNKSDKQVTPPKPVVVGQKRTLGKTKLVSAGGKDHPAHPDAISAAEKKQKMKKSGVSSLSNQELEQLAKRMQLESNVNRLNKETAGAGAKFIDKLLNDQQKAAGGIVNQYINDATKKKEAAAA